MRAFGLIGPDRRRSAVAVGGHLGMSEGFGVPVIECRLLGRRSRVRRTSGCQYRRRGWRQLGRPGPRRARRLARARGSVYRPRHGTPCPPLLPPRRPLAKREQRRERFVYLALSALARWKNRVSLVLIFLSFRSRYRARDRAISPGGTPRDSWNVLQ